MEFDQKNRGNKRKLRKAAYSLLSIPLLFGMLLFPKQSSAYTDYSIYKIETEPFVGEQNVNAALQKLKQDTGWWATYVPTGETIPYYQIFSGGFYGEDNVKQKLAEFQSSTGINASYEPSGTKEPYQKVSSGGFYGEENASRILQQFKDTTGFSATYEPTGEAFYKKKIITGGFAGEENVKQIVQQFQNETGISASYEPTGQYQESLQVVSGGFAGEENIKAILQDFIKQTGVNASYEATQYNESSTILTGGFSGEENVKALVNKIQTDIGLTVTYESTDLPNIFKIRFPTLSGDSLVKATNYLDHNGWWYIKIPGTKIPTVFRIVSEQTLDSGKLNTALNYFKNHGWWAAVFPGNQKVSNIFRIVSTSLTDDATVNKGLDFFEKKGWWVFAYTTNEKYYPIFRIVSEPLLGTEKVNRALDFYKTNGWWSAYQDTGTYGNTIFRIVSQPVLGSDKSGLGLNFFKSHGWWVASYPTGAIESKYKIVTGGFQGYETALGNVKMLSERYGWSSTPVKIQKGPMVTTTNYNMTLNDMLNLEMNYSPQTDKYRNDPAYINSGYVDAVNNKITLNGTAVRGGPGDGYPLVATLNSGFNGFRILGTSGIWTQIALTWKDAKPNDVLANLNPNNFPANSPEYYQFLKLSKPADINVDEVNEKILNANAGVLKGSAGIFAQAAQLYGINEIYLISHALLETDYGRSPLATGVTYNGQTVYNMYGYGAFDSCPTDCGAQKAFEQGWFSPELAIVGGAKLISSNYIFNTTFQQDTLYKMRWNPVTMYHQYATDVGWAIKQVPNIYNLYQMLDNYSLYVDLPGYR